MSRPSGSLQPPQIDQNSIRLLDSIKTSVMLLLGPDPSHHRSPADVSLGLGTLKSAADAMCNLAEKDKLWVEKEKLLAEKEKINAYTEQMMVETKKFKAEKMWGSWSWLFN